jgi:hypothetical protein
VPLAGPDSNRLVELDSPRGEDTPYARRVACGTQSDGRFLRREPLIGKVEIGDPALDVRPIELLTRSCEDPSNVTALAFRPIGLLRPLELGHDCCPCE